MKNQKYSEIPKEPVNMPGAKNVSIRWLISKGDGAENFAMRMFELQPGGCTPLHKHVHEHEVFVVEGQGAFVYEGEEYEFEKGHVMFVPPEKQHCFKNTGNNVLRFLCLVPMSAV